MYEDKLNLMLLQEQKLAFSGKHLSRPSPGVIWDWQYLLFTVAGREISQGRREVQEGKSSSFPTFWGHFSLLPKLGSKIGGGQHTTPALSRKGSIMTFRASPLHQHTTRRGPNHRM